VESLVTIAITGTECITNKQTDKQTDILLYIYRLGKGEGVEGDGGGGDGIDDGGGDGIDDGDGDGIGDHHLKIPLRHMFSACLHCTAHFSSYYQNAAILLVSYIGPPVAREGLIFSGKKVDVDLPLDVKRVSGKFRCICTYGF
jgi:hypothetical protein